MSRPSQKFDGDAVTRVRRLDQYVIRVPMKMRTLWTEQDCNSTGQLMEACPSKATLNGPPV